ncbi:MAG: 30S ribosomal protein S17e [Candidatus Aenigmatarchaeota archaeon]
MGRVRTSMVKNIAEKVFAEHREKFTKDFNHNKKVLESLVNIKSKTLRNRIAGYITSLVTRE